MEEKKGCDVTGASGPLVRLDENGVWAQAVRALQGIDGPLDDLLARSGCPAWASSGNAFQTLARAITGQQISVMAADTVWKRFCDLAILEPEALLALPPERLRACGYSLRKVDYLRDLAIHFSAGRVTEAALREASDAQVQALLTQIRGIGRWSAQMFLIFHLRRPDVFPVDDLGLQRALRLHFGEPEDRRVQNWERYAERWRPWRSVVTWVLWRSLDPVEVVY